jgi:hypothetical protein
VDKMGREGETSKQGCEDRATCGWRVLPVIRWQWCKLNGQRNLVNLGVS